MQCSENGQSAVIMFGLNRLRIISLPQSSVFAEMDTFELNKILGAVLGNCIVVLSANIFAGSVFAPVPPAKPGYKIAAPEQPASALLARPAEEAAPIQTRLAGADVDRGRSISKACVSCHTLEKGGANKVGPNLWGVVGRSRASEPGYDYSAAMKGRKGKWTFEDLDKFLAHPQSYVAGTKMTFSGIQDPERRADLIGYLRTLSDNPVSLPTAPEKAGPSGQRAKSSAR